jgi:hypothetical protein
LKPSLRRALDVDVAPDRAGEVANALRALIGAAPEHPALIPLVDAGVTNGRPFIVYAAAAGQPLDEALQTFGPAEIGDALPRLHRIAEALDFAAAHGVCHCALTPRDILVSADDTFLSGIGVLDALRGVGVNLPPTPPYTAPERDQSARLDSVSDQFSFAAIAYEWLFGRPIAHPSEGVQVRTLPGIDVGALTSAFNKALSRDPRRRFASCTAFVDAIKQSVARVDRHPLEDLPIYPAEPVEPEIVHGPPAPLLMSSTPAGSASTNRRVVGVVIVGAIAAGAFIVWLTTRPRSDIVDTPDQAQPFTEAPVASSAPAASPTAGGDDAPVAPLAPLAPDPPDAVRAVKVEAGLLVHSTPAGAAVAIDGIERGTTPVAVRGLALGTRSVTVTRPGYRPTQRQVTLTPERPSRSLEISLVPASATSSSPTPARDGALVVDSRPAGATVMIDGRRAGVTPLTISPIAPGTYTVRLEHPGYRAVTTTVDVSIGQRARVAARLEGGQHEE